MGTRQARLPQGIHILPEGDRPSTNKQGYATTNTVSATRGKSKGGDREQWGRVMRKASLKGWHLTHQNEGEDSPHEDLGNHAQVLGIVCAKSLGGNELGLSGNNKASKSRAQ